MARDQGEKRPGKRRRQEHCQDAWRPPRIARLSPWRRINAPGDVLVSTLLVLALPGIGAAQQPLRTAVDGTFAPHAMPRLEGGIQGFNVDLANEVGKRLKRPVEIQAMQFSGILPALQAGSLDFVAAPVTVTKERAENYLFTEGYLNTDYQFLTKKGEPPITDLKQFKGKVIAVNKGAVYDSWARGLEARSAGLWRVSAPRRTRCRPCSRAEPTPTLPATRRSNGR